MIVGLMCTIECNHTSKARQIHVAQESTITNCMAMVNATVALVQINKVQRKNSLIRSSMVEAGTIW